MPFHEFSHSALVRLAEEVALQGHLLALSYKLAVSTRGLDGTELLRKQFIGVAGVVAGRLRAALDLPGDLAGAAQLIAVHPAFNPAGYVVADIDTQTADGVVIRFDRSSPAHADGGWLSVLDADHLEPLDAILHAVDPSLHAEAVDDSAEQLTVRVVHGEQVDERPEVAVTRFSTGAAFVLAERRTVLPVLNT